MDAKGLKDANGKANSECLELTVLYSSATFVWIYLFQYL